MADHKKKRFYGPASICRLDRRLIADIAGETNGSAIFAGALLVILVGAAVYGAVFGWWRAPKQAFYAAVKMPIMMYAVTLASGAINAMLAQQLGSGLTFRQVGICILLSFAVTSALLGALSPAVLFVTLQVPSTDPATAMFNYGALLAGQTAVVGLCGTIGTVRLFRLLKELTRSTIVSTKVLLTWLFISGLVGCELSWVMSPFLARPDLPIPFLNPNAFSTNFFEYLWRAAWGGLR